MEVVHLAWEQGGPFPGICLFSQASRMVRPVRQLRSGALELLGTLEQGSMAIRCPDGGHGGSTGLAFTHEELGAGERTGLAGRLGGGGGQGCVAVWQAALLRGGLRCCVTGSGWQQPQQHRCCWGCWKGAALHCTCIARRTLYLQPLVHFGLVTGS
jgi:hypothetical protein